MRFCSGSHPHRPGLPPARTISSRSRTSQLRWHRDTAWGGTATPPGSLATDPTTGPALVWLTPAPAPTPACAGRAHPQPSPAVPLLPQAPQSASVQLAGGAGSSSNSRAVSEACRSARSGVSVPMRRPVQQQEGHVHRENTAGHRRTCIRGVGYRPLSLSSSALPPLRHGDLARGAAHRWWRCAEGCGGVRRWAAGSRSR
eukprot:COSAG01_NODE_1490_length_10131_cov_15.364135_11_plen_200_part_00